MEFNPLFFFFFLINEKTVARNVLWLTQRQQWLTGWACPGAKDFLPGEGFSPLSPTGKLVIISEQGLFIYWKDALFLFFNNSVFICISLITNEICHFPIGCLEIFQKRVALFLVSGCSDVSGKTGPCLPCGVIMFREQSHRLSELEEP